MKTTKGMKRVIFIATFLLGATFQSFSQGFEGKGDMYLNIGIGIFDNVGNGYSFPLNSKVELPTFNANLDIGVHKWITVGPYLSYNTRSFKGGPSWIDGRPSDRVRETWFYFGARGTFKITPFLNEVANMNIPDDLDLYAGVLAGINIYHKKTKSADAAYSDYTVNTTDGHGALLGAGARYFFTQGFGVYLEIYPIGYTDVLNTGFSFKF